MKLRKIIILTILLFSLGVSSVYAFGSMPESEEMQVLSLTNDRTSVVICHDAGVLKAMKIVGLVIIAIKVMVPVFLIVTGVMNLGKAVIYEDDGALKKSAHLFLVKFIVGAFIFFVPTIIYAIMDTVSTYDKT